MSSFTFSKSGALQVVAAIGIGFGIGWAVKPDTACKEPAPAGVGAVATGLPAVPTGNSNACFSCTANCGGTNGPCVKPGASPTAWTAGKVGPVGPIAGSPQGQYNPAYWCASGRTGNPNWGCVGQGVNAAKKSFCTWYSEPTPAPYHGKAFSHTLHQGPWAECSKSGPRCWAVTNGVHTYLVAGVDQNAGTWPNTAIYDFQSGPGPSYGSGSEPLAVLASSGTLGGGGNPWANVWITGYVDCDTGKA